MVFTSNTSSRLFLLHFYTILKNRKRATIYTPLIHSSQDLDQPRWIFLSPFFSSLFCLFFSLSSGLVSVMVILCLIPPLYFPLFFVHSPLFPHSPLPRPHFYLALSLGSSHIILTIDPHRLHHPTKKDPDYLSTTKKISLSHLRAFFFIVMKSSWTKLVVVAFLSQSSFFWILDFSPIFLFVT